MVICCDNYYKRMKRVKYGGNSFQMAIVWHFFKLKGLSFGANQVNSTFHIFDNLLDFARCKSLICINNMHKGHITQNKDQEG